MIKVGLTGGIGSGKSTVARIFESFGIPIYNSDDRARYLMNNDQQLVAKIKKRFGEESYLNHALNRAYLANVVFKDKNSINDLNAIVHPAVANDFEQWVNDQDAPYIVKEAAILIESGAYKTLDTIVVVTANEEVRIARVTNRDGVSEDQVKARMKNQLSDADRLQYAHYTIANNGDELLIPQVQAIHNNILSNK